MFVLLYHCALTHMIDVCDMRHLIVPTSRMRVTDHVMLVRSFVIQRFAPPLPGDSDWELCHDPRGPCRSEHSIVLAEILVQQAVQTTAES
jgi:hypothetical protein